MSNTNFDRAVQHVLNAEGGYTNHPNDKGGPTNYGITIGALAKYRGVPVSKLTADDVKNMSVDEAKKIYKQNYWDVVKLDQVQDYDVCYFIFDQVVNRGSVPVVKQTQSVLNSLFKTGLVVDGKIGQKTIGALNAIPAADKFKFITYMFFATQDAYTAIVNNNHSQSVFIAGWINRSQNLYIDILKNMQKV